MKRNIILLIGLIFLITTACEKEFLDINTNPNTSTEVPPGTLLTNASLALSQVRLTTLNPDAAAYVQYWRPVVVLTGPNTYGFSSIGNDNFWRYTFYGDIIKDLSLAANVAVEEENTNAYAQLKITQAFAWLHGVDRWGEMPFTEANQPDILFPKFDEAPVIYQGILDILDDAIANIDLAEQSEPSTIVAYDPLYAGNMNNWLAFANSLKLRVLMRLSYVEERSAEIASLLSGDTEFIDETDGSENAEFQYAAARVNQNFDFATFDNFTNFGSFAVDASGNRVHQRWRLATKTMVDLLTELDDPRLTSYYQPDIGNPGGEFVGTAVGTAPLPQPETTRGYLSLFYVRQDKSDEWFLASEYYLLAAEAYARGLAQGDAQEALENGVMASLSQFDGSQFEIPEDEKQAYVGSFDLASVSDPVEFIQLQQYLALFYNGAEGWANWRRTKVPDLPVAVGAPINTVISRIEIPESELESNPNAPKVSPLIDKPVYFERPN